MSAFPKFDPVEFLKSRVPPANPAKPANPPQTLAGLATLAVAPPGFEESEERIGIITIDGNVPEPWAQAFAVLQASTCPAWMHEQQWRRLIDGAGRLVAKWSRAMSALGWHPQELLAVEVGVLHALENAEAVAVTAAGIGVRYQDGSTRHVRRTSPKAWVFE